MQRITTYIILAGVFFSGLLLVYRSAFHVRELQKLEGKVIGKAVETVYEHKGKNYYAATFSLEGQPYKPAIYNGTESQHAVMRKVDSGRVYTFLMDPEVATLKGINLGIREIHVGQETIYKESNLSSLIGGIAFCLMALIVSALIWVYGKKKRNAAAFK